MLRYNKKVDYKIQLKRMNDNFGFFKNIRDGLVINAAILIQFRFRKYLVMLHS